MAYLISKQGIRQESSPGLSLFKKKNAGYTIKNGEENEKTENRESAIAEYTIVLSIRLREKNFKKTEQGRDKEQILYEEKREENMASKTLEEVAEYMKKMHFRKGLFGIQPASMWKKLEDLDSEYCSVFYAQELSYEARLKERDEKIAELEKRLSLMKNRLSDRTGDGGRNDISGIATYKGEGVNG